jgi:DNA-binding protein H-NS
MLEFVVKFFLAILVHVAQNISVLIFDVSVSSLKTMLNDLVVHDQAEVTLRDEISSLKSELSDSTGKVNLMLKELEQSLHEEQRERKQTISNLAKTYDEMLKNVETAMVMMMDKVAHVAPKLLNGECLSKGKKGIEILNDPGQGTTWSKELSETVQQMRTELSSALPNFIDREVFRELEKQLSHEVHRLDTSMAASALAISTEQAKQTAELQRLNEEHERLVSEHAADKKELSRRLAAVEAKHGEEICSPKLKQNSLTHDSMASKPSLEIETVRAALASFKAREHSLEAETTHAALANELRAAVDRTFEAQDHRKSSDYSSEKSSEPINDDLGVDRGVSLIKSRVSRVPPVIGITVNNPRQAIPQQTNDETNGGVSPRRSVSPRKSPTAATTLCSPVSPREPYPRISVGTPRTCFQIKSRANIGVVQRQTLWQQAPGVPS